MKIRCNRIRKTSLFKKILCFDSLDSTSQKAKVLALAGIKAGAVVIAETQVKGRGRLGRSWESPDGGIWFSAVFYPKKVTPEYIPVITLGAGIAVCRVIRKACRVSATLKWPNDILIRNKKVCGILTEMISTGDRNICIIGVGLNANVDMSQLSEELQESTTSLLNEMHKRVNREKLISRILCKLNKYCRMINHRRWGRIIKEWKQYSSTIGQPVEAHLEGSTITGLAEGISEKGSLMIRLGDGSLKEVASGEVSLKNPEKELK